MANERSIKDYLGLSGKGAAMGAANIIPGVSGGTIAVVTGIYDELMLAISKPLKSWRFLLFLFLGLGIGLVGFAKLVGFLFENYPSPTLLFFMGLILGGIPIILKKGKFEKTVKPNWVVSFVLALGLVVYMSSGSRPTESLPITEVSTLYTALILVFSGLVAGGTMIIPGVSGSFLLLLMGMYTTFTNSIKEPIFSILILFMCGIALGVVGVAKLMNIILARFHTTTYSAILGLICGSVVALWPGVTLDLWGVLSLLLIPLGALGGYFLGER